MTPANDQPSDAASAFADALRSGAKHGFPEPAPDPRVAAAFALGWQIAVLYRPDRRRRSTPAQEDDLPGIGRLDELEFMELGLAQVQVAISKLHDPVAESGLMFPTSRPCARSCARPVTPRHATSLSARCTSR